MKKILLLLVLCNLCLHCAQAQKPVIDFKAIDNWPSIDHNIVISSDGQYFGYCIKNLPAGSNTFCIESTRKNGYKLILPGIIHVDFSEDSKFAVFKSPGDTLNVLTLGETKKTVIPNVRSYKLSSMGYLSYLTKIEGSLMVHNLKDGKVLELGAVQNFLFDHKGEKLLILSKVDQNTVIDAQNYQLLDLNSGKRQMIWKGNETGQPVFSDDDSKIAFITSNLDAIGSHRLWCYRQGADSAGIIGSDQKLSERNLTIDQGSQLIFSKANNQLFFYLRSSAVKVKGKGVQVDVWSYKENMIYPKLAIIDSQPERYFAVANFTDGQKPLKTSILQIENMDYALLSGFDVRNLKNYDVPYVILAKRQELAVSPSKRILNQRPSFYRFDLRFGDLLQFNLPIQLNKDQSGVTCYPSPSGRWLLYFNLQSGNWNSYDIKNNSCHDITASIGLSHEAFIADSWTKAPTGISGWSKGDSTVLVNDKNDIWQIDLLGMKKAVNLTNYFGHHNQLCFRVIETMKGDRAHFIGSVSDLIINKNSELLLSAFNTETKYNGLFRIKAGHPQDPELLTMGPYSYCNTPGQTYRVDFPGKFNAVPLKAKDTNVWIIGRTSVNEAPEYFATHDFSHLTTLTNLQPQENYKWLSMELVNWNTTDGLPSKGILYKPEDFDPNKKYPIIFTFYKYSSDQMYDFLMPNYSTGNINIAYFISHGYLVFAPDICYRTGEVGESVIKSIVSSANYLGKTRNYIDTAKMAISGESFGGFEINFLVTHTNKFAAAEECCGVSDFISDFGELHDYDLDKGFLEFSDGPYYNFRASLWERPDLYIKNSPVFNADKVTTPLLVMHNKNDKGVPFIQGVEFFSALWELKKPVWLLQYDGEGHGLGNVPGTAKDFTIRLEQFFDHYLKGKPAPKWMVEGIRPSRKGIDDGLALESGKTP